MRAATARRIEPNLAEFKDRLLSAYTPEQLDQWIDLFAYCVFNTNGGCKDCDAFHEASCQRPKNPFCAAFRDCDVCGVGCTVSGCFQWFQDLVDKAEEAGVWA